MAKGEIVKRANTPGRRHGFRFRRAFGIVTILLVSLVALGIGTGCAGIGIGCSGDCSCTCSGGGSDVPRTQCTDLRNDGIEESCSMACDRLDMVGGRNCSFP